MYIKLCSGPINGYINKRMTGFTFYSIIDIEYYQLFRLHEFVVTIFLWEEYKFIM